MISKQNDEWWASRKLTLLELPQINREKLPGWRLSVVCLTTNILITIIIKQDISLFLLDNEPGFISRISHIIESSL